MNDRLDSPWNVDERAFPTNAAFEAQARFLLRYAILAPSSHNSQPWEFGIRADAIDVFADESRWLEIADADKRELFLSVGCAIENLRIAAAHFGYAVSVDYRPSDGDDPVATVHLDPDAETASRARPDLFDAITDRHTTHHAYDDQPIPEGVLDRLRGCVRETAVTLLVIDEADRKESIGRLQLRADEHQFDDAAYRAELGHWIGTGALGASWLMARVGRLAVTHLDLGDREGRKNAALLERAPVLAVLVTETDDDESRMRAGQAFERLTLLATSEGIAHHPVSQTLEVPQIKSELAAELGLEESVPQHLFRLGYSDEDEKHTPRRPLEEVVR
ncbi:Acg family FMN-binding oxidoreductase [Natrinema gelatinilyticum]|uniref:Acg family FMN-binding oxidoreductase n=1 Tax=Natrinema gelatinilyticum TaxID=2961571 RepID=UPI0020C2310D|nr:nitroreductase family protein [Natrinema gelatinilyticum]